MDAVQQTQATIGQALPWTTMTFDYTEQVAALLTDELRDWRPEDPSGQFFFSLGEIVAHCADSRRMFARQLSGSQSEEGYWSQGPDEQGVWKFTELPAAADLVADLKAAREELAQWMGMPAGEQWNATDGTRAVFEKHLQTMRETGKDTGDAERRGPANINRILFAAAAHESGHRGSLQTLLRMKGLSAGGEH
jgi:uncharacterized damage-inducible protein DinB